MKYLVVPTFFSLVFITGSVGAVDEKVLLPGCGPDSYEAEYKIESELVLAEDWLPKASPPRDAFLREAISQQLLYTNGYFQNDRGLNDDGLRAMGAWRAKPEILSVEKTRYAQKYTIDTYRVNGAVRSHPYLSKALAAGATQADQAGLRIKYQTRARFVRCAKPGTRAEIPSALPLPGDPFLAIWAAPESSRRTARFGPSTDQITPCATDEMADMGNALDFWYLWNPNREGCAKHLADSGARVLARVTPAEKTPLLPEAANLMDSLRGGSPEFQAGILFGQLTDKRFRTFDYAKFGPQVAWLKDDRRAQEMAYWNQRGFEPGAGQFLLFLKSLPSVMTIQDAKTAQTASDHVMVEISGKLLRSQNPVRIRTYYGTASIHASKGSPHWKPFYEALKRDHLVFFNAHAGLGKNLRVENVGRFLKLSEGQLKEGLRTRPAQLLAFMNCFSYSLFGEDFLKAREGLSTDLLLAATKDTGARYALSLLRTLDRNGLSEPVDLKLTLENFIPKRSYFVYRRVK